MRTTLDIDDRALAIARAKAAHDRISLGRALSELVLDGVSRPSTTMTMRNGIPVFPGVPGHVITPELVEKYRDGDPDDDA